MITKTDYLNLDLLCTTLVLDMASVFLNPKGQGPNFTWKDFPGIIANLVGVYSMNVKVDKVDRDFAKKYAVDKAKILAERFVRDAGLV